jgi:hypothetical protein
MHRESEKALNDVLMAEKPLDAYGDCASLLFNSEHWFAVLAKFCFPENTRLTIGSEHPAPGSRLEMIRLSPFRVRSLSNWYSFRWEPLGNGLSDVTKRQHSLQRAMQELRHHAAHALFEPVPAEKGAANEVITALRTAGWHVSAKVQSRNAWAEIGHKTFDQWWAERPGQLRSTVARKAKKAVVEIEIVQTFSDAHWSDYCEIYEKSWKETEGHPAFLRALASEAAARGALRLGFARIEGRVVAAQFWTVESGVASIHKLAQIADSSIDAYSPGTLLTHALYREVIEGDNVLRVDFGTGKDGFKSGWTDASCDLMAIEATDFRQLAGWRLFGGKLISRVAGGTGWR